MSLIPKADVLVIGGGVIGASVAFHLAVAGVRRVVLCEQGAIPGCGATRSSGGLLRMHHTNRWQVQLAWRSFETYSRWADVVGGDCGFRQTGFACIVGREHADLLDRNLEMLSGIGVPTLRLSPEEFVRMQPACSPEQIGAVAYEPFSGYADPVLATHWFSQGARQRGAALLEGVSVIGLLRDGDRVRGALTSCGEISAGAVVLAANAGAPRLLKDAGLDVPLQPRRISVCYLSWSRPEKAPALCTCIDDSLGTYFRPMPARRVLVGVEWRRSGTENELNVPMNVVEIEEARSRVSRRVPSLRDARLAGTSTGVDGYTPDGHAVVGRTPNLEGLYLAVGFSGGGFKVAPAVGRAVAEELTSGGEAPELGAFRLRRFESGDLIRGQHTYSYM